MLWVPKSQAFPAPPHSRAAQNCGRFLQRSVERRSYWSQQAQLALRATTPGEQVIELSGTPSL